MLEKARDCHTTGCGAEPIDSIEVAGGASLLPDILINTGMAIIDPLVTDPESGAALEVSRVNAYAALTEGFHVPLVQPELQSVVWSVDGYGNDLGVGGNLRVNAAIDAILPNADDLSGATVTWEIDDGSLVADSTGNSASYSNCAISISGSGRGSIVFSWGDCRAIPDELDVKLKTINPFGVSRSLSEVIPIAIQQPAISFRTRLDTTVDIFLEAWPLDLDADNCELRVFLDGEAFDVIQTGTATFLGDNGFEVECLSFVSLPTVSYSLRSLLGKGGKPRGRVEKPSNYTLQLCDMAVSTPEPESCSAVHVLPRK